MNWSLCIIKNYFFFYIHLGYSFNSILMSHIFTNPWGGIPPPGRDIVGKNQSTWRHCHCLWSIPSDVLMQSTLGMALGMWLQLAVFSILLKSTLIVPTLSQSPLCHGPLEPKSQCATNKLHWLLIIFSSYCHVFHKFCRDENHGK